MKRLMNFLFLSCKRSTELFEKKLDTGLSRMESLKLHIHTSMCSACTTYQKQSKFIDDSLSKISKKKLTVSGDNSKVASELLQDKIIKNLNLK